jgi:hypothetical protein
LTRLSQLDIGLAWAPLTITVLAPLAFPPTLRHFHSLR